MNIKLIGKFLLAALTAEKDLIVGGQAVIEGVMMRTPGAYGIAVRKPDGTIALTSAVLPKWSEKYPVLKLPILRGGATLIQSMALGIKALNFSASEAFVEEEVAESESVIALQPAGVDGFGSVPVKVSTPKAQKEKGSSAGAAGSIVFAMIFNILLFIVAPLLLTNALFIAVGWAPSAISAPAPSAPVVNAPVASTAESVAAAPWYQRAWTGTKFYLHPVRPSVLFNLIDGGIRMLFFITMIFFFSMLKDIRRVFEYHGAEHKTVFTWEYGLPLTVENARGQKRQHPRCGTSFLMVVMLVSIALFSVIKFDSLLLNMSIRIALMPLVAGLSYEIIRLSAKKESSIIFKMMTRPGVWLQNITTKEPDDGQLEVAIEALKESLKLEPEAAPAH
ncbi:MAG: DUF1385 domain-containing protein [Pyrinomonadaceae bacterium]